MSLIDAGYQANVPVGLERRASSRFSIAQARAIVSDLFDPNPWIYWTDFLASFAVGCLCFQLVRQFPLFSLAQLVCFTATVILYYRCGSFIHELMHIKRDQFVGFRVAWNLLCGIPFLIPSFVYWTHIKHHQGTTYGTHDDGEYLPFAKRGPWMIVWFLTEPLYVPLLAVFRFLVLTPLTWFSPAVRRWVLRHASSMIIDPSFVRPELPSRDIRIMRLQEVLTFLWCAGVLAMVLTNGRWPFPFLIQAYATGVCIVLMNNVRTLVAHRWTNGDDEPMTFSDQVLDSLNFPHHPLMTELWAPVGMRFHALHHLFPSLPYHNMPEAHRRLTRELPPESPYHELERRSFTDAFLELWRMSQSHRAA
jgi:fatty acid desaturase